jgi:hypothetical protein
MSDVLRPYGIECVHISCGEAQLEESLQSIRNQLIPFDRIVELTYPRPLVPVINGAISYSKYQFTFLCAGDYILNNDASYIMHQTLALFKHCWPCMLQIRVPLYDPFVEKIINGVTVYQTHVNELFKHRDVLHDDIDLQRRAKKVGYFQWQVKQKEAVVIGTHFKNPDDFQIFKRFFGAGAKTAIKKKEGFSEWFLHFCRIKNTRPYQLAKESYLLGMKHTDILDQSHNDEIWRFVFQYYKKHLRSKHLLCDVSSG